jgi:outer membrane protein TolC
MVVGLIEESDIYSFESNVDLKKSDLLQNETRVMEAETRLRVALNLPPEKIILADENLSGQNFPSIENMIAETHLTHPCTLKNSNPNIFCYQRIKINSFH